MKKLKRFHIIWLVALVLLGTGVVLSLRTLSQLTSIDQKLRIKLSNIEKIQKSARDLSVYISAKESYKLIPGAHPVKFESVFDMQGLTAKENIRVSETSLEDDWFVLHREVVIDDAELGDVMRLVRKAEAQRPPWKLSSCNIKSSSIAPGHGRVVLIFTALEQR